MPIQNNFLFQYKLILLCLHTFSLLICFYYSQSENTVVLKDSGDSVGILCTCIVASVWKVPVFRPCCIACYRISKWQIHLDFICLELESLKSEGKFGAFNSNSLCIRRQQRSTYEKSELAMTIDEASFKRGLQTRISPIDMIPAVVIAYE